MPPCVAYRVMGQSALLEPEDSAARAGLRGRRVWRAQDKCAGGGKGAQHRAVLAAKGTRERDAVRPVDELGAEIILAEVVGRAVAGSSASSLRPSRPNAWTVVEAIRQRWLTWRYVSAANREQTSRVVVGC